MKSVLARTKHTEETTEGESGGGEEGLGQSSRNPPTAQSALRPEQGKLNKDWEQQK